MSEFKDLSVKTTHGDTRALHAIKEDWKNESQYLIEFYSSGSREVVAKQSCCQQDQIIRIWVLVHSRYHVDYIMQKYPKFQKSLLIMIY